MSPPIKMFGQILKLLGTISLKIFVYFINEHNEYDNGAWLSRLTFRT
jgi:hypothetical protein